MKHEKESENIKKAEEAVDSYPGQGYDYGGSSHDAPPPYFPQDPNTAPTTPPSSAFSYPDPKQYVGGYKQQYSSQSIGY
ncbi:hypothetical protein [Wolbachia endosymbiont of Trichogramma kaykai]|uniref:hypothetical protein n=1 Tax=Wolbachia endosymbiont of Trichogramma kaykai TaxID=444066 RepID=UPI00389177BC